VKQLRGTAQPCRLGGGVQFERLAEAPPAPEWLPNAHAVKEWDRLARLLASLGLLTHAGLSALGQLCALHGKVVQLYAAGEAPPANLTAQLRGFLNDFGLTPASAGKVQPDEGGPANKFAGRRSPRPGETVDIEAYIARTQAERIESGSADQEQGEK
jgi:hypothetical protein